MKPRHFWWLVDTLEKQKSGPSLTREERGELMDLVARSERGEI